MRYWDGLDAKENKNLVESGEVGDEMGENSWNSCNKLGVNEANATDSGNTQVRTQGEQPVDGNFVFNIKLILFQGSVMPTVHDS